jgi:hypothetical protein
VQLSVSSQKQSRAYPLQKRTLPYHGEAARPTARLPLTLHRKAPLVSANLPKKGKSWQEIWQSTQQMKQK